MASTKKDDPVLLASGSAVELIRITPLKQSKVTTSLPFSIPSECLETFCQAFYDNMSGKITTKHLTLKWHDENGKDCRRLVKYEDFTAECKNQLFTTVPIFHKGKEENEPIAKVILATDNYKAIEMILNDIVVAYFANHPVKLRHDFGKGQKSELVTLLGKNFFVWSVAAFLEVHVTPQIDKIKEAAEQLASSKRDQINKGVVASMGSLQIDVSGLNDRIATLERVTRKLRKDLKKSKKSAKNAALYHSREVVAPGIATHDKTEAILVVERSRQEVIATSTGVGNITASIAN